MVLYLQFSDGQALIGRVGRDVGSPVEWQERAIDRDPFPALAEIAPRLPASPPAPPLLQRGGDRTRGL